MKEFSKYVLATIVGIFATGIVLGIMGMMSIVGMVASSEATQDVEDNTVMVLNLNGTITEQAESSILTQLSGGLMQEMGLNDILAAIEKAKNNDDIKGIYIEAGALQTGYATVQEIRQALADFKKSGKWIVAYGDEYSQGAYYLASVADKIYLNPDGMVDIHGIATEMLFMRDLYAKFGIHYQVIKVGKYKSATEVYSEDHMSDANREQVTQYVTGLWNNVAKSIAASRKISVATLNSYADNMTMMSAPEDLKKMKLVDGLLYHDQVKAEVKKLLKLDEDDVIPQISISEMGNVKEESVDGDEIAVYYAYGNIVDAASDYSMGESEIIGKDMSDDLEDLMNNDDVKAVVIRVNSPGGSAFASEQIWHAVTKLKEKKPVVVSMGDYAASGGYYISCNASWIVAQPTTLTGSIGIFGVIPEGSELFEKKLNLHFDGVKTNKHSDFGAGIYGLMTRPFTAEESDMMQNYINRGYSLFRKRVADGRKQKIEQIEAIAQGHVWLGQDAIGIKLVDELGGLNDAIAKAAQLAKIKEYYTSEYPAPQEWTDQLMAEATGSNGNYLDEKMKAFLGEWYLPFVMMKKATEKSPIQASMPFVLSTK